MTQWNRAYLDALEVPVWVPLSVQEEEKSVQSKGTESKGNEPSADTTGLSSEVAESNTEAHTKDEVTALAFIQGDQQADFIFVVSQDADKSQAQATLKKLERAWRLWLEQPFSAAIAQINDPSSQSQTPESTSLIEECRGKIIACDLSDSLEHPSIPAPHLDFSHNNKKDWWSLLQRLQ